MRERRERLGSGQSPTVEDLRRAREAAGQAVIDAEQARHAAAAAYARAAQAHRDTAAAMHTNGLISQAQWHREQAIKDDNAAAAEPAWHAPPAAEAFVVESGTATPLLMAASGRGADDREWIGPGEK